MKALRLVLAALIFLSGCTSAAVVPDKVLNNDALVMRIVVPTVRVEFVIQTEEEGQLRGHGSGTIIGKSGDTYYVLTAGHVTSTPGDRELYVSSPFLSEEFPASVAFVSETADIAVIGFECKNDLPMVIFAKESPRLFDVVYMYGFGRQGGAFVTKGIVSNLGGLFPDLTLITVTASTWFGCSGGGIFNEKGYQVGIGVRMSADMNWGAYLPWLHGVVPLDTIKGELDARRIPYAISD